MPYVRKRGKQLVIVHGKRDPETKKVEQRILFTIYSKAEAQQILGRSNENLAFQFQQLLGNQYPEVRFNWRKLNDAIQSNIHVLPDLYQYKETRLLSRFRGDLCAFARQLMLADPQDFMAASHLIEEHAVELEYLVQLIQWRLDLRKQDPNEWNVDNPFYWRFTLQEPRVPPDIEEEVAGFYEKGDYSRAKVLFRLLIDCFEDYAEGYNYLGLIALDQERLEEAIGHFRKTIETGRKHFPKKISRKRYWSDLSTRPYMRGLRNLTIALIRSGRYEDALRLCDRLEKECMDEISATAFRATAYLNLGHYQQAADSAVKIIKLDPSESLIAGFAVYELGRTEDALALFIHGALNYPRAARMILGIRTDPPQSSHEARDHNAGIDICRDLNAYLRKEGRRARRFFKGAVKNGRVGALLNEMDLVIRRWREQHPTGEREAFDRMNLMQKQEFARQEAQELLREVDL
ncbi:MAG: tetratricopeptide repeat protein [Deltaproteobacteria bacterium]|nr:tetratricopeptide repeat protein [Deltaproteobacteria bacterium]